MAKTDLEITQMVDEVRSLSDDFTDPRVCTAEEAVQFFDQLAHYASLMADSLRADIAVGRTVT